MAKIKISQNKFALVDDEDFEFLSQWKWHLSWNGYAIRREGVKTVRMHRIVNKTPVGTFTDHINQNRLDNRKSNLRNVTKSQNAFNTKLNSNNRSSCKGVYWEKFTKKWRAEIKLFYKKITLGRFKNFEDAVRARKEAESYYHAI